MKNHQRKQKEQGQIIILLAVSIVVVMMVAALAVDGGMIYTERRFAQNAADAAGFAGGGAILNSEKLNEVYACPSSSSGENNLVEMAITAAQSRASANNISSLPFLGYIVNDVIKEDYGLGQDQGIIIECIDNVANQPIEMDIFVRVTSQVSTAFAHLIYPGPLQTTNESVVTLEIGKNSMFGNALVALGTGCDKKKAGGIYVHGTGNIKIFGGGAFSNTCLYIDGNKDGSMSNLPDHPEKNSMYAEGGFNIVYNGTSGKTIDWLEPYVNGGQIPITEFPEPTNPSIPSDDYIDCSDLGVKNNSDVKNGPNGEDVYSSGKWSGIGNINKDTIFEPGLYCISGDIKLNGNANVEGVDVTFYMVDGVATFNGSGIVNLVAPTDLSNPYHDVLFYFAGQGSSNAPVTFNGNNTSYFSGQVYAPKMWIDVGGSSNPRTMDKKYCSESLVLNADGSCDVKTFTTQFVGWHVTVGGTGDLDILFNGKKEDFIPTTLYLQK